MREGREVEEEADDPSTGTPQIINRGAAGEWIAKNKPWKEKVRRAPHGRGSPIRDAPSLDILAVLNLLLNYNTKKYTPSMPRQ